MGHPRFHLAIPVDDLDAARRFYGDVLQCPQGRESDTWVDWDLYGHQLVTHLADGAGDSAANPVDGHDVPGKIRVNRRAGETSCQALTRIFPSSPGQPATRRTRVW